jgi:hypothetical protein
VLSLRRALVEASGCSGTRLITNARAEGEGAKAKGSSASPRSTQSTSLPPPHTHTYTRTHELQVVPEPVDMWRQVRNDSGEAPINLLECFYKEPKR